MIFHSTSYRVERSAYAWRLEDEQISGQDIPGTPQGLHPNVPGSVMPLFLCKYWDGFIRL